MKLAIRSFAANVGFMSSKVRTSADPYHAAYIKATPEQQSALRREWMLGHLEGQGFTKPERILSRGKAKGVHPDTIKAIDRASSDFRYMVVRPVKTDTAPTKRQRVSSHLRESAMAFLSEFEGESLEEQIKQALAVLRSL